MYYTFTSKKTTTPSNKIESKRPITPSKNIIEKQSKPIESIKKYINFINDTIDFKTYRNEFKKNDIVCIKNFINVDLRYELNKELEQYNYYEHAFCPNNGKWEPIHLDKNTEDGILKERYEECIECRNKGLFSYSFKRQIGEHYDTCMCVSCKLYNTLKDTEIINRLEEITGICNLRPNEVFLSKYTKGDFLTTHHDKDKGKIAVVFSLTEKWNPNFGGTLHFVNDDDEIYKSITPKYGNVCIFNLQNGIKNHFVSEVNVNKSRYMISAWYG